MNARNHAYWPYAQQQSDRIELWNKRSNDWLHILDEIILTFKALRKLERRSEQDFARLQGVLQKCQDQSDLTNDHRDDFFRPLKEFVEKIKEEHGVCQNKMREYTLHALLELRSFVAQSSKSYRQHLDVAVRKVGNERKETEQRISTHQSSISVPSKVDPWLIDCVLQNQLDKAMLKENQFQTCYNDIHADLVELDKKVVAEWTKIFKEFVTIKKSQWHETQNKLTLSCVNLQGIEPGMLVEQFMDKNAMKDSPAWTTIRRVKDFPYKVEKREVLKISRMHRPGKYRKSTWRASIFLVTESGYLHCFKTSKEKDSALNDAPISELTQPKAYYSINLSRPRVSVNIVEEKAHLYVFEIVTKVTGKSWTSFVIRAQSEQEMLEWVALLKTKVEAYLAETPPMPLFASHQVRANKVGEMQSKMTLNEQQQQHDGKSYIDNKIVQEIEIESDVPQTV